MTAIAPIGQAGSRERPIVRLQNAVVVGAGGRLGSALLAEALVAGRFQRVVAVAHAALASSLRGLELLPEAAFRAGDVRGAEVAFVVFERERHSNGRDDAFFQPDPDELPALARTLRAGGVRRLVVVVPHAPMLLPQALRHGFASQAESEVAGLGFDQLVFVRTAQFALPDRSDSWLRRFAQWWLSQLKLMVPRREQPVLADRLAAFAVALARRLPLAPTGTRVVPAEVVWQAAQGDAEAVIDDWLLASASDRDAPAAGSADLRPPEGRTAVRRRPR